MLIPTFNRVTHLSVSTLIDLFARTHSRSHVGICSSIDPESLITVGLAHTVFLLNQLLCPSELIHSVLIRYC